MSLKHLLAEPNHRRDTVTGVGQVIGLAHEPAIVFVLSEPFVYITHTENVAIEIAKIREYNPRPVRLIAFAFALEADSFRIRFHHYRHNGKWFRFTGELARTIKQNRTLRLGGQLVSILQGRP